MSWCAFCGICIGPWVNVSFLERTRMHYVTCRSHWMQKQKFDMTCPGVLFIESESVPPDDGDP
jgi:hypothetical protein